MRSILITAFEPYDSWPENASWLCLLELTRHLPQQPKIVTRRYPVDFAEVRRRLEHDLASDYDVALHLGQAPGSASIHLEAIGLNVGGHAGQAADEHFALEADGPLAYRSGLPLARWARQLGAAGIPARVSYHAGTFLCNATLYWSQHLAASRGLKTRSAFVHLPLDPRQVVDQRSDVPSLPAATTAAALRHLLEEAARLADADSPP